MTTHHPTTQKAGKNNGGQDVKIQMTNEIQMLKPKTQNKLSRKHERLKTRKSGLADFRKKVKVHCSPFTVYFLFVTFACLAVAGPLRAGEGGSFGI